MAHPGIPGSQIPKGEDWVPRALKDIEIQIRELTPSIARSFAPVIARLDATDVDLIAKQATLDAQQATLTTTVDGLATAVDDIAANLASIDDLIGKQVSPSSRWLDASNFGLTTAWAAKVTISVTVPAGFTQLQVMAAGRLIATNSTAAYDYKYVKITIGAATQSGFPTTVSPGGSATSVTAYATTLTGLASGGTVDIVLWGKTGNAAWAVYAPNAADLSASLLWLR